MSHAATSLPSVAVVGGGPAGLMAAEAALEAGASVDLYDAMPSVGRKFLLAGKGGMNLTHSEPADAFNARFRAHAADLVPLLRDFGPEHLRAWAHALGISTFVGTSGRVFPADMKAAPLLRAWLHRLRSAGARIHARHRWTGWNEDRALQDNRAGRTTAHASCRATPWQTALRFATPAGDVYAAADAVVLALGGASWPQLGGDGAWVPLLAQRGVPVAALRPANCGFDVAARAGAAGWSAPFLARYAGAPLKSVRIALQSAGLREWRDGECVITATGIEGGLVYALSAELRDEIDARGAARIAIDLAPGWNAQRLCDELARPRGSRSLASHVQSRVGIKGVKMALLRELAPASDLDEPSRLAAMIKALPLDLIAPRPLAEAISTAGGVSFEALDRLMVRDLPGVFCAGEMLDWEAPTGGYLLTASMATGYAAGRGAAQWATARSANTGE